MKLYGLIGYPLSHSFSEKFFNSKFTSENLSAYYRNFEIKEISSIGKILKDNPDLVGLNVTAPYKKSILSFLDSISPEASRINAVNCIRIEKRDDRSFLSGYNTDIYGFQKSLLSFIPPDVKKAIVLGNGGAAQAVKYVLENLGMEIITTSRRPGSEKEISYQELPLYISRYPLIINCSPVGMYPHTEEAPELPYHLLTPEHYLYDLIYNPEKTSFLLQGEKNGAHIKNGMEMLILQAEESWRIWENNRK